MKPEQQFTNMALRMRTPRKLPYPLFRKAPVVFSRFMLCILIPVLILVCGGCGKSAAPDSPEPEMVIGMEGGQTVYNGTEQRFYQVEKGQTGDLRISVQVEGGSLNILVYPTDVPNHFCYRGREIPTSEFTVRLSDAGEYTVWIEADSFSGSYELSWEVFDPIS